MRGGEDKTVSHDLAKALPQDTKVGALAVADEGTVNQQEDLVSLFGPENAFH